MFGNFTKEEKEQWNKINGNKKGLFSNGLYSFVLWVILVLSFMNGITASSSAQSAIQQIYGGISFLIATMVFCTLAILSMMNKKN